MLWLLTPEDHLSPWAMICWMTSHMVSFARRPLIEGRVRLVCGWPPIAEHGPSFVGSQKPNAPVPVRGRSEDLVWGLPTLTTLEQEEVDGDSLLILRPDVPDDVDETKLFSASCFLLGNIPGTHWSAAPLHQQLAVPVCGPPRRSRHGIPRWVIPW